MNAGWVTARSARLSLATRIAVARARARRRRQGGAHAGWPRLMLRWRRRRPRLTCAAAGRHKIATHNYWFPAFHLHLTGGVMQSALKAAASDARRLTPPYNADRGFRHGDMPSMWRNSPAPKTPRGRRRAARVFEARHLPLMRIRPLVLEELREVKRTSIPTTTSSLRIDRGSGAPHQHELALAHPRSASARWQTPGTHRPAELAWRTLPQLAAIVDRAAGTPAPVSARPQVAAAASTADASHADKWKDVLSAASVDARLLDRLTDDVIRRVERRIRIERERRGL